MADRRGRKEDLPDAARAERTHRVSATVPVVEVADDADADGVGRPHRKVHAVGRADAHRMGAELFVDPRVIAFAEEIQIVVTEDSPVAIRIVDVIGMAAGVGDAQRVIGNRGEAGEKSFENSRVMAFLHRHRSATGPDDADLFGPWQERANNDAFVHDVRPEYRKGVVMPRFGQRVEVDPANARGWRHASVPAVTRRGETTERRETHASRSDSLGRSPGPPSEVTPALW